MAYDWRMVDGDSIATESAEIYTVEVTQCWRQLHVGRMALRRTICYRLTAQHELRTESAMNDTAVLAIDDQAYRNIR